MGRFFDAASSMIGLRHTATYEGQAAIELEDIADPAEPGAYGFDTQGGVMDPAPLWQALLADWRAGVSLPILAARVHNSVVNLAVEICLEVRRLHSANIVALSGGVWQNMFLLSHTVPALESAGFRVLIHHKVPANDGGLALGQALIAGWAARQGKL